MRPEFFTNLYGLIVDYLAEYFREMRKTTFADSIDTYFLLGNNLNQRDTIAVRKTVSGLLKLLYPHGEYDKETVEKCLHYALECRRRVKEQLKRLGGMEFYDVHFSYIDQETREEKFVGVPEQGGSSLIPEGPLNPGTLHTVGTGSSGQLGLYRIELQMTAGNGKLSISGVGSSNKAKEPIKVAFDYFKANASRISASLKPGDRDYHLHIVEMHNTGPNSSMTLPCFLTLCSGLMGRPVQGSLVVLGDMSLGGNVIKADNLAASLQVAFDAGAKRILVPMSSVGDIRSVPGELFAKFQTSFYLTRIELVVIESENLGSALKIFETINQRGAGLNAMDLVKNMLFSEAREMEFGQIKETWRKLTKNLDDCGEGENPLRFLKYFLVGRYHKGVLREDEIYKWIISPQGKAELRYQDEPLQLARELERLSARYSELVKATEFFGDGGRFPHISHIGFINKYRSRQHLVLLLALPTNASLALPTNASKELLNYLGRQIEAFLFFSNSIGIQGRTNEQLFARWVRTLREAKDQQAVDTALR
ncbi:MAG: BREX system Lon protease-like protein BrxL, partial [Desulfovermiculus sp.]|nr:BREX system Lon protease-like protein BrxL [Desulfovermiculus sp.]